MPLLIITGSLGSGKTTVGYAASSILAAFHVPHAFLDRDALCASWPPEGRFNEDLAYRNMASVWANYRDAGASRLVVSGVVEKAPDLNRFRSVVEGAEIVVCRLRASQATREERLRARDDGEKLDRHLARTVELEQIVEQAGIEDFSVVNEGRPVTEVAEEMLEMAGWIGDEHGSV